MFVGLCVSTESVCVGAGGGGGEYLCVHMFENVCVCLCACICGKVLCFAHDQKRD